MVDDALARTRKTQTRIRDLPARVVVYLLIAAALFPDQGYQQVWQRLTAALHSLAVASPSSSALRQARQRLTPAPMREIFRTLSGPAPGNVRWHNLLVVAIDGTTITVPDSDANRTEYRTHGGPNHTQSGYPLLRLLTLVACGTRTIIDATFGSDHTGETTYTPRILAALQPGMILLADRNFATAALIDHIASTGAHLLVRSKNNRHYRIVQRLSDGTHLALAGSRLVRIVNATITIATSAGRHTGTYRLVTTCTDPCQFSATDIVALYHQRWEIETSYLEIKSTTLHGRVLRSRTPTGVEQEMYALLIGYQALRRAIADAASGAPEATSPDRASFTIALHTARDQIIHAAGVIAETHIDLIGVIGQQVLAHLLPARRTRSSRRAIKRSNSKYQARGATDRTSYRATISIDIITETALATGPGP